MAFGAIIIGDEILSGRRQDKHLVKLIELLAARGLSLAWARYCGDDRAQLTALLRESLAGDDIVFSFGGIGATPDDHTRQSAAAAAGVALVLHPEAEAAIRERFGDETTPLRLRMGEFPAGSRIIPNPYNRIPGFAYGRHHFLPGFPEMAWPMAAWILDTWYADLHDTQARVEASVIVYGAREGDLIPFMEALEAEHGVSIFSLPSLGTVTQPRHIELGAKGEVAAVEAAMALIKAEMTRRGLVWVLAQDTRPAA
ncbi:MAG: competence/damage-inducible protein A [Candidatus Dactylopiibacterium carminicum]|uniref:Competence/damage-inducible protein A n=1 Tax=Candidatus Dactylopiibacterium carminicum TaxID=857335 RepID=A0A272EQD4_9RHOO|nr:molybdopterin-binding protein [Candidatus Dactylopiibacterium carminicum]KAF7598282.1 competence/damage-inducible protein A [Candidatus Dactylopiibacterium carminicum]PAS91920.1 MAG: competence/damage-inducible protein A [Candidatus Dactylopiibacterium carminicum]PAS94976.1 MAG: competence/damage-inducible protein A [Candidatus Dactylopiibacterium carminicum]PAS97215.1 MAG: competence/damage-inducible protein A [Candidatus Dactylopiibacterium carminicum]